VTLKAGITLDGKLATSTGKSKWITSEDSRNVAHELRDVIDAIIVGAGTVEADDPALTTRLKGGRNAVRVVLDSGLRTKAERQIFDTKQARTILVTPHLASRHAARGVEVWSLTKTEDILRKLASEGLLHVMVEGGAFTHGEFLKAGLFDELVLFIAPKLFGHDGLTWSGLLGIREPAEAIALENLHAETVGEDLMITATRRR
jgi:diaminohydroxyphosphoribosylaminopyrimidine deaminase/5-amino-6-(5-phosphoribosylamino)uracil reductase